jgi:hypothetical protein
MHSILLQKVQFWYYLLAVAACLLLSCCVQLIIVLVLPDNHCPTTDSGHLYEYRAE